MPAANTGSCYQNIFRLLSNSRKQHQLSYLHRELEMFFLVTKRPGHTTTTRRDQVDFVATKLCQYLLHGRKRRQRFLLTVAMKLNKFILFSEKRRVDPSGIQFFCKKFFDHEG